MAIILIVLIASSFLDIGALHPIQHDDILESLNELFIFFELFILSFDL